MIMTKKFLMMKLIGPQVLRSNRLGSFLAGRLLMFFTALIGCRNRETIEVSVTY